MSFHTRWGVKPTDGQPCMPLAEFLARLAAKDPAVAMPALKVRIQDGNAVEYFWVTSPSVSGQVYSGTIDNDPETV